MKVCGVFVTTVATLLLLLSPSTHAATPRTLTAAVDRVSDGDTLVAITANQTKLHIRLLGIDAPETPHGTKPGQPFGQEAREHLDHLIGGKTLRVDAYGPDKYKRILAVIWDEQVNVNLLMVAMGYAEVYRVPPAKRIAENWSRRRRRPGATPWGCGRRGACTKAPQAFAARCAWRVSR